MADKLCFNEIDSIRLQSQARPVGQTAKHWSLEKRGMRKEISDG